MSPLPLFLSVLGHEKTEERLAHVLSTQGGLTASLLITGPEGIGKALFARKLACALLSGRGTCSEKTLTAFCSPAIAQEMQEGTHPDFMVFVSHREEGSIAQIRQVLGWIVKKPLRSSVKVALFEDVDRLNRNATNALLKTLEEPPEDTFLLLTSAHPERLLLTIRSRCLLVPLSSLPEKAMARVLEQHQLSLESSSLALCAGSPGKALALQTRETLYPQFLQAIQTSEQGNLSLAREFAEKEDIWPFFSWFSLHFLHASLCTKKSPPSARREALLALWRETHRKIVQGEYLNLDKKAVILWFFCAFGEMPKL
ncbi:MAG: AAA family ATPase [Holosporales bacterium]|jgi:DNA polymerase-3 subunit delta'|nr:AAA family ATPase [Holosporales bacterium]